MPDQSQPPDEPFFRAVASIRVGPAPGRPVLLLAEFETPQGPLRLSLTKGIALRIAEEIAKGAHTLAPDRSAN